MAEEATPKIEITYGDDLLIPDSDMVLIGKLNIYRDGKVGKVIIVQSFILYGNGAAFAERCEEVENLATLANKKLTIKYQGGEEKVFDPALATAYNIRSEITKQGADIDSVGARQYQIKWSLEVPNDNFWGGDDNIGDIIVVERRGRNNLPIYEFRGDIRSTVEKKATQLVKDKLPQTACVAWLKEYADPVETGETIDALSVYEVGTPISINYNRLAEKAEFVITFRQKPVTEPGGEEGAEGTGDPNNKYYIREMQISRAPIPMWTRPGTVADDFTVRFVVELDIQKQDDLATEYDGTIRSYLLSQIESTWEESAHTQVSTLENYFIVEESVASGKTANTLIVQMSLRGYGADGLEEFVSSVALDIDYKQSYEKLGDGEEHTYDEQMASKRIVATQTINAVYIGTTSPSLSTPDTWDLLLKGSGGFARLPLIKWRLLSVKHSITPIKRRGASYTELPGYRLSIVRTYLRVNPSEGDVGGADRTG